MARCTVVFEDDLEDVEVQLLSQAIQRFRGVKWVEREDLPTGTASNTGLGADLRGMQMMGVGDQVQMPSEFQMPPRNQQQQQFQQQQFQQQQPPPNFEPAGSVNSQRHFIDKAIRWGIQNQKISIDEIKNLPAESIVQLALKLIDSMPEHEKRQLGEEMSHMQ